MIRTEVSGGFRTAWRHRWSAASVALMITAICTIFTIALSDVITETSAILGATNLRQRDAVTFTTYYAASSSLDPSTALMENLGAEIDSGTAYTAVLGNVEIEDKTKFGIFAYAVNTMKSVMTDQVFNINVETENGNYVGEASHVLVLLTNYFADKKIFEEDKDGYANILILKDASIFSKLSVIPDLLKGDVVGNDNIEYIRARNIKISSDSELESDVDGDKSDNLPVEIKVLAQRVEVFSKPKE